MGHLWVLLSLLSAFSVATNNALLKKVYAHHNEYTVTWLSFAVVTFLLLLCLPLVSIPTLDAPFFRSVCIALPLEVVAIIYYIKALKISPLSLTLPFMSLTPVFLIAISYVLAGEAVSSLGGLGIFFIALGSYTLNIREFRKGFFQPFLAIARERGSLYMIVVAFIYSVTSALGKNAIVHSSPLFFAIIYWTGFFLLLTPVALWAARKNLRRELNGNMLRAAVLPGVWEFVGAITYTASMSLAKVAYVISVRRLSVLIGVIYGFLLFRESAIRERFVGTALMLTGFVIILFAK